MHYEVVAELYAVSNNSIMMNTKKLWILKRSTIRFILWDRIKRDGGRGREGKKSVQDFGVLVRCQLNWLNVQMLIKFYYQILN